MHYVRTAMQQIVKQNAAKTVEKLSEGAKVIRFASAKKEGDLPEPPNAEELSAPFGLALTFTLPESERVRLWLGRLPRVSALRGLQDGDQETRILGIGRLLELKLKLDGPQKSERRGRGPKPSGFDKLPAAAALNAFDSLPPEMRLKLAENLQETAERAVGAYIQESFGLAATKAAENVPLADRIPTQEIADRTAKLARRFLPFVK